MKQILTLALESGCSVWHDALALGCSNFPAQICLAGFAEFAFFAFRCAGKFVSLCCERKGRAGYLLESNDVISNLHVRNSFANRLHDTSSLVSENNGESTLGVLSRKCVCICQQSSTLHPKSPGKIAGCGYHTSVAHSSVMNLNSDLVCPRRQNLDILDDEVFSSFPCYGRLGGCYYAATAVYARIGRRGGDSRNHPVGYVLTLQVIVYVECSVSRFPSLLPAQEVLNLMQREGSSTAN